MNGRLKVLTKVEIGDKLGGSRTETLEELEIPPLSSWNVNEGGINHWIFLLIISRRVNSWRASPSVVCIFLIFFFKSKFVCKWRHFEFFLEKKISVDFHVPVGCWNTGTVCRTCGGYSWTRWRLINIHQRISGRVNNWRISIFTRLLKSWTKLLLIWWMAFDQICPVSARFGQNIYGNCTRICKWVLNFFDIFLVNNYYLVWFKRNFI